MTPIPDPIAPVAPSPELPPIQPLPTPPPEAGTRVDEYKAPPSADASVVKTMADIASQATPAIDAVLDGGHAVGITDTELFDARPKLQSVAEKYLASGKRTTERVAQTEQLNKQPEQKYPSAPLQTAKEKAVAGTTPLQQRFNQNTNPDRIRTAQELAMEDHAPQKRPFQEKPQVVAPTTQPTPESAPPATPVLTEQPMPTSTLKSAKDLVLEGNTPVITRRKTELTVPPTPEPAKPVTTAAIPVAVETTPAPAQSAQPESTATVATSAIPAVETPPIPAQTTQQTAALEPTSAIPSVAPEANPPPAAPEKRKLTKEDIPDLKALINEARNAFNEHSNLMGLFEVGLTGTNAGNEAALGLLYLIQNQDPKLNLNLSPSLTAKIPGLIEALENSIDLNNSVLLRTAEDATLMSHDEVQEVVASGSWAEVLPKVIQKFEYNRGKPEILQKFFQNENIFGGGFHFTIQDILKVADVSPKDQKSVDEYLKQFAILKGGYEKYIKDQILERGKKGLGQGLSALFYMFLGLSMMQQLTGDQPQGGHQ